MAAAILASVPLIIVYSFLTKFYVSGLTRGAVKG
jgi:ABC-type maltose transport system permease subunit